MDAPTLTPRLAPTPTLTLDLGNSRLKGSLFPSLDAREPCASFVLGHEGLAGAPLDEALARLAPAPRIVALASVADLAREEELVARVEEALGLDVWRQPDHGLELRVRHPETVGVDRLYAARAALDAAPGAAGAIAVDAGTALTVDAVLAAAPAGRVGTFLGGAIAPGPALLARALAAGGARLPEIAPRPGVPALGRETREALEAGVAVGFEGAASHLVARVAREAGLVGAPVVLTGGARAFLEAGLAHLGAPLVVDPWLVDRGLLAAARALA